MAKATKAKPLITSDPDRPLDGRPTLFTLREAASYLGVTERRMRRAVERREVPFTKIGKLVRFRQADLDKFIEANLVPAKGR
jgi:excisionase family DNA binding protein